MDTTIAEDYLLLAYDERTGYPLDSTTFTTVLGAAVLLDLVAMGAVEIDGSGKQPIVRATMLHVADPLLQRAVTLADGKSVDGAVAQQSSVGSANLDALRTQLLEHLVELGALRLERGKFLWIFPTAQWKEADGSVEAGVRSRVRAAITAEPALDGELDDRSRALVGLASHGDVIVKVLPDLDATVVRERAKQIAESEATHGAVASSLASAVASMSAALLVTTIIVPTITT